MKNKISRMFLVIVTGCLFLAISVSPAFAATAIGGTSYTTCGSRTYGVYSRIDTTSSVIAATLVGCTSGGSLNGGYAGITPRLYTSNGTLKVTGVLVYNGSSYPQGNYYSSSLITSVPSGNIYYSHGTAVVWNTSTSGYVGATSTRSPNLNF